MAEARAVSLLLLLLLLALALGDAGGPVTWIDGGGGVTSSDDELPVFQRKVACSNPILVGRMLGLGSRLSDETQSGTVCQAKPIIEILVEMNTPSSSPKYSSIRLTETWDCNRKTA